MCAYNEADNIERSIRSVYEQKTDFKIKNVIVVSSGSMDGTDDIVRDLMQTFPSLRLIRQETRMGKNSAMNLILENNRSEIITIINADTVLLDENAIANLIAPFDDDSVGIVGGRPIPVNDRNTLAGFASNMMWVMHHHISLITPKIGELIAFRDIGVRLPMDSQSDEDILKMALMKNGYKAAYAPGARISIKGPETVDDFMKQRVRVNIGQIYMTKNHQFMQPAWHKRFLIPAIFNTVWDLGFHPIMISHSILLELRARSAAKKHVAEQKKDIHTWDPVGSTKRL